jgi:hypothetical protein
LVVTHPASAGTIISLSGLPLGASLIDEDDNVLSFELSPRQPLWKQPPFIALVVMFVAMVSAALGGRF